MQDRASEYQRTDASTLPRRPLAPTQRRIAPRATDATLEATMDATMVEQAETSASSPRLRADSAARALRSYASYSGASAMGAPTMVMPGTTSSGMGQATAAPGLGARAVPYLPPSVAL